MEGQSLTHRLRTCSWEGMAGLAKACSLLRTLLVLGACQLLAAGRLRIARKRLEPHEQGAARSWQATKQCLLSLEGSPSVAAVEALRAPQLRQRAQRAAATGQGKLQMMLYHVRKAGGTSLRTVLVNSASKRPGVSFRMLEGLSMDLSAFHHPSSVFITHLREPISRIASSFRYDFLLSEVLPFLVQ